MILYSCPSCAEELEVPDRMAGRKHPCPACGDAGTVPDAGPRGGDDAPPANFRRGRPRDTRAAGGTDGLSVADLRQVAVYQRGILFCIVAYFGLVVGQFGLPPDSRMLLLIGAVPVAISAVVFVFLLASKVYGGAGIALAILTLVPLLGQLILLVVNQKATGLLQARGYSVGLLGAPLSQFDRDRRRRGG